MIENLDIWIFMVVAILWVPYAIFMTGEFGNEPRKTYWKRIGISSIGLVSILLALASIFSVAQSLKEYPHFNPLLHLVALMLPGSVVIVVCYFVLRWCGRKLSKIEKDVKPPTPSSAPE